MTLPKEALGFGFWFMETLAVVVNQSCEIFKDIAATGRAKQQNKVTVGRSEINESSVIYLQCIRTRPHCSVRLPGCRTDSWILSVTCKAKAKIQSRGVVNPAGLTNWLLSPLRGINLSDLTDSARAMKCYSAHRLNT